MIAVYDFGGGTFDAAVVRKTPTGFELLGAPAGMERFGGIDLDQAVLGHVMDVIGDEIAAIDPQSEAGLAALSGLLAECRLAKEALSADTDVTITAALPTGTHQVRMVRSEFEEMIRPRITETVASLRRAVAGADLEFDDVSRVLMVGGTSRIPAIAEAVGAETGRPVAVDAHPKHAVALGAAVSGRDHFAPQSLPADGTARWGDIQAALREARRSAEGS